MARPVTSRSPRASSAPSEATCQSPLALWPGDSSKPSTSSPQSPISVASGRSRTSPACVTPGSAADPLEQRPVERHDGLRFRVLRLGRPKLERQHAFGLKAEVDVHESIQALQHQAGAEQKQNRDRRLGAREHSPAGRSASSPPTARRPRRAAPRSGSGEGSGRPARTRRETWSPASGPRRRRASRRRSRSAPSSAVPLFPARAMTRMPAQAIARPSAAPATASTKLSVRSCRVSRAWPAPIAERTAISRWRPSARESSRLATLAQAMSIRKPTAPKTSDSARRASPRTSSSTGTANASNRISWRVLPLARQVGGHGLQLRRCPRHGRAAPQLRRAVEAVVSVRELLRVDPLGNEELRRLGGVDGEVGREREAAGHHAHDAPRRAVELDRAADDRRIAAEAVLPETVREDDDGRPSGSVLVRREGAPQDRRDAEGLEGVRRSRRRCRAATGSPSPVRFARSVSQAATDSKLGTRRR